MIKFGHIEYLYLLVLIPILLLFIFLFIRWKNRTLLKFTEIFLKEFSLLILFSESLSTTRFLASGFNILKDKSSNSSLI